MSPEIKNFHYSFKDIRYEYNFNVSFRKSLFKQHLLVDIRKEKFQSKQCNSGVYLKYCYIM